MQRRTTQEEIKSMKRQDLKALASSTIEVASPEEFVIIVAVGQIDNPVSLSILAAMPESP